MVIREVWGLCIIKLVVGMIALVPLTCLNSTCLVLLNGLHLGLVFVRFRAWSSEIFFHVQVTDKASSVLLLESNAVIWAVLVLIINEPQFLPFLQMLVLLHRGSVWVFPVWRWGWFLVTCRVWRCFVGHR